MTADGGWLAHLGLSLPASPTEVFSLDTEVLDRLAERFDVDRDRLVATIRSLVYAHGGDLSAFEMRSDSWRIDLPAAIARSVVTGSVGATMLQLLGAESVPAAIAAAIASLAFDIKRVEILPSDLVLHAQLRTAADADAQRIDALYRGLPADMQAEVSPSQFADAIERLHNARLAVAGPEGIRIQAGARRGFRLVVRDPHLDLHLRRPTPHETAAAGLAEAARTGGAGHEPTAPGCSHDAGMAAPPGRPRVFVTYAHDSPAHDEVVLEFCKVLTEYGLVVEVDEWGLPVRKDRQTWAHAQMDLADYVIVVGAGHNETAKPNPRNTRCYRPNCGCSASATWTWRPGQPRSFRSSCPAQPSVTSPCFCSQRAQSTILSLLSTPRAWSHCSE